MEISGPRSLPIPDKNYFSSYVRPRTLNHRCRGIKTSADQAGKHLVFWIDQETIGVVMKQESFSGCHGSIPHRPIVNPSRLVIALAGGGRIEGSNAGPGSRRGDGCRKGCRCFKSAIKINALRRGSRISANQTMKLIKCIGCKRYRVVIVYRPLHVIGGCGIK